VPAGIPIVAACPWMRLTFTRTEEEMPVNRVLAGVAVADVATALPWYERLFGRPADALPMEGLAEWHVPSGGVVQLVANRERAGRSLLTLDVADLAQELAAMRERGLDAGPLDDTTSDKVLIASTTDPEGNAITLVQQR
jgi:predicted enzyme related to lactoylglutathione lyase